MLQDKSHHSRPAEIILEIGILQTRIGLSIDSLPRKTIKTSPAVFYPILQMLKDNKENQNDLYRVVVKQEEFQLKMEEYLYYLFDQELAYNPKDKSVALIYQYYAQEDIPNTIAKLLFTKFGVSKVSFLVTNVLPLYITGLYTGLVIDAGYLQTTATPIFEGHPLFPLGGNVGKGSVSISVKLIQQIFAENPSFIQQYQQYQQLIQSPEWLEEIKFKLGKFVPKAVLIQNEQEMRQAKITIPVFGQIIIQLSYYGIVKCYCDALFGDVELEEPNIAHGIIQILEKLMKQDIGKKIIKNVVICGGLSQSGYFVNRLKEELLELGKENSRVNMILKEMVISDTFNSEQNLNWIGGSIISQIQATDRFSLNEQQFKEKGYMLTQKSDIHNYVPMGQQNDKKQQRHE